MSEAVVSTRIRLARNLKEVPFPNRMTAAQAKQVIDKVWDALKDSKFNFKKIEMTALGAVERHAMAEKHLISPDFAKSPENRALILSQDSTVAIMLGEEDHIRIQVILPGFCLEDAYERADEIDNIISQKIEYAFSEKFGYLTECPTNLGTALRASVMLHLPALDMSGSMARIGANLSKLGLTLRGLYGEGSKAAGSFYQLSNQVSLGISEESAITNLKNITAQLVSQEMKARDGLTKNIEVDDRLWRSLGTLKTARLVNHAEAMRLLSDLRLGVSQKLFDTLSTDSIDKLITEVQPANILQKYGEKLSPRERDIKRAELLRERLN